MEHRQYASEDQIELLELIEFILVSLRRSSGLSPRHLRILRIVAIGDRMGQPYDVSSLAEALALSRATTMRCIERLEARGLVHSKMAGRRCVVRVTDLALQHLGPPMDKLIDRTLQYADRIRERNGHG